MVFYNSGCACETNLLAYHLLGHPPLTLPFFNAKILIIRRFIVQNLCLEFRRNRTLSQNQGPNSKIAERYAFGTSLARGVRGLASPNYC